MGCLVIFGSSAGTSHLSVRTLTASELQTAYKGRRTLEPTSRDEKQELSKGSNCTGVETSSSLDIVSEPKAGERRFMFTLKGVIPALVTPSDSRGNLDLKPIPKLIRFLLKRSAGGLFVGGTSGEGFFLDCDERKQLAEKVVEEVAGRVPVVIHVASLNFREALNLATHARIVGASAVSAVLPFYFTYKQDEIVDYYRAISE